eukprot:g1721.t1
MAFSTENAFLADLAAQPNGVIDNTFEFAEKKNINHLELISTLKRLAAEFYVVLANQQIQFWTLTKEGEKYATSGTPEFAVFNALPSAPGTITREQLEEKVTAAVAKIGVGKAMAMRTWINFDKATNSYSRKADCVTDDTAAMLRLVREKNGDKECISAKDAKTLKKRKLISLVKRNFFSVKKGPSFSLKFSKAVPNLTVEMLQSGAWKTTKYKPYNWNTYGKEIQCGLMHPLMKVRAEFRKILLQMGFEEMPTNQFVESSFWNFDTLFQPQSHPARDAHDTFFISDPEHAPFVPEDYLQRVKNMHEKGGPCAGGISLGYGGKAWDRNEALKNVLRTHTTSVSSKMLYKLGQEYQRTGVFEPKKYFSIDRVFRNETLDATHLAEFHQVEFFIASADMTLGDLIGLLETFFIRIGITKLRFKPAYNPYTEPSMEIFGWHPGLNHGKGSWTEVGNSGMFRPEMLGPMGLPENVRVIAGGLSLERPTMIKYGINNIRELFGHKIDLDKTKAAPIARFFAYENA